MNIYKKCSVFLVFALLLSAAIPAVQLPPAGASAGESVDIVQPVVVPADKIDDYIRMNQLQMIGTHNSYHIAPEPELMRKIRFFSREAAEAWDYTHLPLREQLELQNARQIELDVYADPEGGLFSDRAGMLLLRKDTTSGIPELDEPGFKVLHVPHIDYGTHCYTFIEGLETIRDWSLENSNHLPVMILVEVKGGLPLETLSWPLRAVISAAQFLLRLFRVSVEFPVCAGAEDLDALEAEILSVFDKSHIITPDEVRGDYSTLEEAVLAEGWPSLGEARGRVFFALDNEDEVRELYLEGSPSLEGRVMFTSSPPGEPSAAFIKMNDPQGENEALIREYVRAGYIIRTRADADLMEVRAGDVSRREAAFNSGAQYISTDFPSPGEAEYAVSLPKSAKEYPARCNPVNGILACTREILENLE